MSALQGTQPDSDALLWFKYGYVALTSLWVYDYILCIPASVTYLVESRWGLGTLFYLVCSYLPSAFLLLGVLTAFQPNASNNLCRSYDEANLYTGFLTMFCAECIFLLRALAVYHRERKWAVLMAIVVIAHVVPIILCFHKFSSSVSGACILDSSSLQLLTLIPSPRRMLVPWVYQICGYEDKLRNDCGVRLAGFG
ncbi:hypothetical protein EDB19DRAFT_92408 [Suillus lakei]|nr:hypothetical protein EDB19DRAFT_92408 [Suillus lakei]